MPLVQVLPGVAAVGGLEDLAAVADDDRPVLAERLHVVELVGPCRWCARSAESSRPRGDSRAPSSARGRAHPGWTKRRMKPLPRGPRRSIPCARDVTNPVFECQWGAGLSVALRGCRSVREPLGDVGRLDDELRIDLPRPVLADQGVELVLRRARAGSRSGPATRGCSAPARLSPSTLPGYTLKSKIFTSANVIIARCSLTQTSFVLALPHRRRD